MGPRRRIFGVQESIRHDTNRSHLDYEFWISTMTIFINVAWDVSSSPNDRMFMFSYVRGEEHYKQIWRLEGVETDGWNLWDVYHYEIVAVHWASDGNAKTEITMRYLHSYWWQGVYESPSQD